MSRAIQGGIRSHREDSFFAADTPLGRQHVDRFCPKFEADAFACPPEFEGSSPLTSVSPAPILQLAPPPRVPGMCVPPRKPLWWPSAVMRRIRRWLSPPRLSVWVLARRPPHCPRRSPGVQDGVGAIVHSSLLAQVDPVTPQRWALWRQMQGVSRGPECATPPIGPPWREWPGPAEPLPRLWGGPRWWGGCSAFILSGTCQVPAMCPSKPGALERNACHAQTVGGG